MSWNQSFQYGKKLLEIHSIGIGGHDTKEDRALPLGAKLGSLVKLQQSPFIRASVAGTLLSLPAQFDRLIQSIGHVRLPLDGNLYRYYFAPAAAEDPIDAYLQIYEDNHGQVVDVLYCTRLTQLIPDTFQMQEAYMGKNGSGLGEKSYSLWREQCEAIGVAASDIAGIFSDGEELLYDRDIGSPTIDFIKPLQGAETRIDDAQGEHGLHKSIYFMPYVRKLGDSHEFLHISTDIIDSQDGDPNNRSITVNFMIGLPLELDRVVVQ